MHTVFCSTKKNFGLKVILKIYRKALASFELCFLTVAVH